MKVAIQGRDFISQYCALEFKKDGHQIVDEINADLVIHGPCPDNLSALNYVDSVYEDVERLIETETKFILLSSSDVYGANQIDSLEDSGPWSVPETVHAASKYWAEDVCRIMLHKDQFRIARLASVYGPGDSWPFSNPMHYMLWRAANRKEVDINPLRECSWMHAKDAARAIVKIAENWDFPHSPTGPWQTYNVCDSDNLRPDTEIAEIAYAIAGAPLSLIKYLEGKEYIINPSNARLKTLYKNIQVRTVSGILETLAYMARWDSNGKQTVS